MLDDDTKLLLRQLADRYETTDFLEGDPSWFMHQVKAVADQEAMALMASTLSYGSRQQFMPKIRYILQRSEGRPCRWLLSGRYADDIPDNATCFYRLYTCHTMNAFLRSLSDMLRDYGSIGAYVASSASGGTALEAVDGLCRFFARHDVAPAVPKDTSSACKRLCMFLRWMVRDGSPVDLGLWNGIIDKRTLIVPLDTHVLQEATRLRLISGKTTSMATARRLTATLAEAFPNDPARADFALFGYGVSRSAEK